MLLADGDSIDPTSRRALASFVQKGGGLVAIHAAAQLTQTGQPLNELLGARIAPAGAIPGPIFEYKITISDPEFPVVHRIQDFRIDDQLPPVEILNGSKPFLTAWWGGKPSPIAVWRTEGLGKVIYLANGHDAESAQQSNLEEDFSALRPLRRR